jgi:iron-sulfur cluster repair protein YtfE (RIC family)
VHAFETLIAEHRAIRRCGEALLDIVDDDPDTDAAHSALSRLSTELLAHLETEDTDIYPLLMNDRGSGMAHAAAAAIEQFESLTTDWNDHVAVWTREAIARDWPRFARTTHSLVDRLSRRISVENELLYPLALRGAHIRLRN